MDGEAPRDLPTSALRLGVRGSTLVACRKRRSGVVGHTMSDCGKQAVFPKMVFFTSLMMKNASNENRK